MVIKSLRIGRMCWLDSNKSRQSRGSKNSRREANVSDESVIAAQRSLALSIKRRHMGGVTGHLEVITAQNAALSDE
jgi:outer membrane protein TolC